MTLSGKSNANNRLSQESANQSKVRSLIQSYGHLHFGFTRLTRPLTMDAYIDWLLDKQYGGMNYLKTHEGQKNSPQTLKQTATSAITIVFHYKPHPYPSQDLKSLRIASYVGAKDYHLWLKQELELVATELSLLFPDDSFVCFTDSSPILERDLGYMSGLGWYGKNTCLIDRKKGSFFLIGEIYTSLELENPLPLQSDFCGTCNRCIEACPTQALSTGPNGERRLQATRCISYLTIESKTVPPQDLREQMGDWFFGCDICQDVCPWNAKLALLESSPSTDSDLEKDLSWILTSSNKDLLRSLSQSPLSRAAGWKLKRNALIVAGNRKIKNLENVISSYLTDEKLGELAKWSLEKINEP